MRETQSSSPDRLWDAAAQSARAALNAGALQPIRTVERVIIDGPIRFVTREVSSLLRKFAAQASAAPARNPFLPFEPALHVADLSAEHVLLLNKFPVMAEHLLVITRQFVAQDSLIALADFVALAQPMLSRPCIAFYNAGRDAGASQPHRHLQLVPLPLESGASATPIDAVLQHAHRREGRNAAPELGYNHALGWLDAAAFANAASAGEALCACYRRLLAMLDIDEITQADGPRQSHPYNLIATRDWMLIVPRSRERYEDISINALGFAGSLFVKDERQFELVQHVGPRALLARVT